MRISFADFYYYDLSNKTLLEIKLTLQKQKIPAINGIDSFLRSLKKNVEDKFHIHKIDFPYYHYHSNKVHRIEEILIDASINDFFTWQVNSERNKKSQKLELPRNLKRFLTKYNNLLNKKQMKVFFDTGFYRTRDNLTNKIEENFLRNIDSYFKLLKSILLHSPCWQERVKSAFLLGYATKKEKSAINLLKKAFDDPDHAVHNMAARSLFPKIVAQKVNVLDLQKLLEHHNPYCQNKFLGIAAHVNWDIKTKKNLCILKPEIKKRINYSQKIVSDMAKSLMRKYEKE